jgi:hypothetical protein
MFLHTPSNLDDLQLTLGEFQRLYGDVDGSLNTHLCLQGFHQMRLWSTLIVDSVCVTDGAVIL